MEGWSIFITELKQHIVYPEKTFILVYCVLYMYMWCATSAYVFVDGSFYGKNVHKKMRTYILGEVFIFLYVFAIFDSLNTSIFDTPFPISVANRPLSVVFLASCRKVVPIIVKHLVCKISFEATLLQLKIHPIYLLKRNSGLYIFYNYMLILLPVILHLLATNTDFYNQDSTKEIRSLFRSKIEPGCWNSLSKEFTSYLWTQSHIHHFINLITFIRAFISVLM